MNFKFPAPARNLSFLLMGIGLIALIGGFVTDVQRTWVSLLINNFFFLAIAIAGVFFMALQNVSKAGWSVGLKKVPEVMGAFLPYAAIGMLIIMVFGNHDIYHWTHQSLFDEASADYDPIIAGKEPYLNLPFFLIRTVIYLGGWCFFAWLLKKYSNQEDLAAPGDLTWYNKSFVSSALFIIFFAITSSTASWDWIMSIDTHWFSTIFGWYVFSGLFVSGLVVMTLLAIYLKKQGYLPQINENHFHDLGKYIFAFSIFWSYLRFCQFMLIWYSNIPEEVTYYTIRLEHFNFLFIFTFLINFLVPFLVLMTRDSKRKAKALAISGFILIAGHWLNTYLMIVPGAIGDIAAINFTDVGLFMGFTGSFVFVTFKALEKTNLVSANHIFYKESLLHEV
ncbi:MAG: quinol:cytochrome C oxidoreductase [Bacteroidetes bacterium]|nr:quinol:cytochrome C oxidoreductase [Bacteroidota bacterium]